MQIFQKVHRFSRSVAENGYRGHEKAYASLRDQIAAHDGTLSPPSDSDAPQRTEGARGFNPHLLLSRATLYGSALILHSSSAGEHPEARNQMLKYTQELVTIFRELQEHQRLHSIQSSLVSLLHAMNASRIIAPLLDFMDTVTIIYSAWTDAPLALKDTLISATSWLQIQDG
ncbi:hypothetical protein DL93DRAFT_1689710 [Clavulina sp. PMI_390]|nr:hypothetical protein DL93DRAFT_1689710 [Clavulina sp. PMI_390]